MNVNISQEMDCLNETAAGIGIVYINIYIYINIFVYVYIHVNVFMYVYIYMYICMYIHIYTYIFTCLRRNGASNTIHFKNCNTGTFSCHVATYTYMYTHVCICI